MNINTFTLINLILLTYGYALGTQSFLWKISCCNIFGTTISFSCVPFFDSYAYERQRKKRNFTVFTFYMGHFVLHVLPCMFVYYNLPFNIYISTCIMAFGLKILWAICSCGNIYLNDIYVTMENNVWEKVWMISLISHFLTLFLIKNTV